MIKKALQFIGRSTASIFGAAEKRKTLQQAITGDAKKVTTREEWLRERRRQHCLRNNLAFGAPGGTKSHRRLYYSYNPSWFRKPEYIGFDPAVES